jgi:DNA replication protein DnaC
MAQAAGELMEQGAPTYDAAVPILSQLLKPETAEREVRSVAYRIKAPRFPVYKDLSGFNFASSEANEALVRQLHRCAFIENADNAVLVGGLGMAIVTSPALGVQAVEHHRKKVRFLGTVDLVNALEQEKAQGRSDQIADRLKRRDPVVLNEPEYLPFSVSGGALLFHLLSKWRPATTASASKPAPPPQRAERRK